MTTASNCGWQHPADIYSSIEGVGMHEDLTISVSALCRDQKICTWALSLLVSFCMLQIRSLRTLEALKMSPDDCMHRLSTSAARSLRSAVRTESWCSRCFIFASGLASGASPEEDLAAGAIVLRPPETALRMCSNDARVRRLPEILFFLEAIQQI
jgi:hypothetical protein